MSRLFRLLGSLTIAVPLLIAIAAVLGWGTIYEVRFGTAAVQQFIYQSWWFQGLLAFLALNLALAALERYPWQRKHLPFLLAHLGIMLILIGGIIGGRFGIEGQLVIPEGHAERILRLPQKVLVVRQLNPGIAHVIPTRFETRAWVHEPQLTFHVPLEQRTIHLTVDRYFPNAEVAERVQDGGTEKNPAIHLAVSHEDAQDEAWLFAKDPDRFGARWGEAHVLFFAPETEQRLAQLLGATSTDAPDRGVVTIEFPELKIRRDIPVPKDFSQPIAIEDTPYVVTFKDSFTDFAITPHGVTNRSDQPNNPAIALTLTGPEGTDGHLVFALHPDFPAIHGVQSKIPARVTYTHATTRFAIPPNSIGLIRHPSGELSCVLTGDGGQRQAESVELGRRIHHPWLGFGVVVDAFYPRAMIVRQFTNRDNEVRAELLHIVGQDGKDTKDAWLGLRSAIELSLGEEPITVEYREAEHELPVTITLLDFRKIDYPGTQMALGFESDVEVTDSKAGLMLMRTISMNNPLRYKGFSFYQASYIPGPIETTVLAVRKDPGTPIVYAGFLIVILGIVSMFLLRSRSQESTEDASR